MTEPVKILTGVPQDPRHPTYAVEYWVVVTRPYSSEWFWPAASPGLCGCERHGPFTVAEADRFIRSNHDPMAQYVVDRVLRHLR